MNNLNATPVSSRLHIGLFGKRNAGKSSLINAITHQDIALVSEVAGTTTDPVYKTMELLPLGPVVMIDTAGLDDEGELGNLRMEKTYDVLRKTNVALVVIAAPAGVSMLERELVGKLKARGIATLAVLNQCDCVNVTDEMCKKVEKELGVPVLPVSARTGEGVEALKKAIGQQASADEADVSIVGDLIQPGDWVVLVTPIDKAAPKGRLILPQQQTIRDILEQDAIAVVTKEHELKETLEHLGRKPALVITDSQAFLKVSADTPPDISMTSFSILLARQKGELIEMVRGLKRIQALKQGSKVLIVEGCTHHRQADDIGKVKIPRWIRQIAGVDIIFEWTSGMGFPRDISMYDLIVHCGGCMLNKQEMRFRMQSAQENHVAITNYGMLIAYVQGILQRALRPFPAACMELETIEDE